MAPYRPQRINKELGQDKVARTFGPYVSRRFRDALLDYVCETFGVRTCARLPRQVCLRYHMGRCCGICEGHVSAGEYARIVARVTDFLSYPHDDLIVRMRAQMQAFSERRQFEAASRVRDQVRALESTLEHQVVDRSLAALERPLAAPDRSQAGVDHDQAAIYFGCDRALIADVRGGKVLGLSLHELIAGQGPAGFLLARYASAHRTRPAPPELIVNRLERRDEVARVLSAANGAPVEITVPQEGIKRELLEFCERNYHYRVADDGRPTALDDRPAVGDV